MKDRLKQIIAYKTGGRQTTFCDLLGWKPPYLAKLLRGEDFGIKPIRTILSAFPDIDARWFLLGTGSMLSDDKIVSVHRAVLDKLTTLFDIEKYLPVMTPEEIRRFEALVVGGTKPIFSPDVIDEWEHRLTGKEAETEARFAAANSKSTQLCKTKRANK